MRIVPLKLGDARAWVGQHHRHHPPPPGGLFAIGLQDDHFVFVGCAIIGRPVARHLDDGFTAEVTRCCTDGTKNACSMLYAAAWRAARAMGYQQLITYTLETEPGTSLRAAGWRIVAEIHGRSWSCKSRPRIDKHPLQNKIRWEAGGA